MTSKIAAVGLCALVSYFSFHAFAGDQGLAGVAKTEAQLAERQQALADVQTVNDALRSNIRRLTPGTIDPDLIETIAREDLELVYPNEVVLMDADSRPAF